MRARLYGYVICSSSSSRPDEDMGNKDRVGAEGENLLRDLGLK